MLVKVISASEAVIVGKRILMTLLVSTSEDTSTQYEDVITTIWSLQLIVVRHSPHKTAVAFEL